LKHGALPGLRVRPSLPYDDRQTGNLLSLGFTITAPTGPDPYLFLPGPEGLEEIHDVLLQPFVGYIWNGANIYFHGFTAVLIATDSRDVTFLSNDFGVGWWLYNGRGVLSHVVPTVEAHINTPLNHRHFFGIPEFHDSVDLTGGAYIGLGNNALLGIAIGTPLTGPKLFDYEALVNFNWMF